MADYLGMLGLGGEEAARAAQLRQQQSQALAMAQLSPQQQMAYMRARAGQQYGQGLGDVAQGVAGQQTAQGQAAAVRAQLQQALAGVDPSDIDKFFPILIKVLSDNGMIAEARQAAAEYEKLRLARVEEDRRVKKDASAEAIAQARLEVKRPGSPAMQLLDKLGELDTALQAMPADDPKRKGLERQRELIIDQLEKRKIEVVDLGDRKQVVIDGVPTGVVMQKGIAPKAAGPAAGDGPMGKPTKTNMADAQGRDIWIDKNGTQWVENGAGGWERAQTSGRNTADRAMSPTARGKVAALEPIIETAQEVVAMLNDPRFKGKTGFHAYANKFADMLDRYDAAGVPLRAKITDMGSFLLHARSGAAVTAQEFDRLRGFIPQPTDPPGALLGKLASIHSQSARIANAIRRAEGGEDKGYGSPMTAPSAPRAAPAAAPSGMPSADAIAAEMARRGLK